MPHESHDLSDATLRLMLAPGLGPVTLQKLEPGHQGSEQAVGVYHFDRQVEQLSITN